MNALMVLIDILGLFAVLFLVLLIIITIIGTVTFILGFIGYWLLFVAKTLSEFLERWSCGRISIIFDEKMGVSANFQQPNIPPPKQEKREEKPPVPTPKPETKQVATTDTKTQKMLEELMKMQKALDVVIQGINDQLGEINDRLHELEQGKLL